jgi:hypothetical protein
MKVVHFTAPTKCLAGTLARHPVHGICSVVRSAGATRTLLCETHKPLNVDMEDPGLGFDDPPGVVLFSEEIEIYEVVVNVNDLVEVPLHPDPMQQPVAHVVGLDRKWNSRNYTLPAGVATMRRTTTEQVVCGLSIPLRCPVGALAQHGEFGICEVTAVDGDWRTVSYEIRAAPPVIDAADGDDWNEVIGGWEAVVHANELRWLRPELDMACYRLSRIVSIQKKQG